MGKCDLQEYDYIQGKWHYIGTSIRRTSWERGTQVTSGLKAPATKKKNCSNYAAGSQDGTAISTAVTWSDGISLSPLVARRR